MECLTLEEVAPVVLRERMAAVARYLKTQGQEVWIVLRYVGVRKVSNKSVRPSGWLK